MKALIAIAVGLLAGCALQDTSQQQYHPGPTGVVGPDGHTIIWDQPAPAQYAGGYSDYDAPQPVTYAPAQPAPQYAPPVQIQLPGLQPLPPIPYPTPVEWWRYSQ